MYIIQSLDLGSLEFRFFFFWEIDICHVKRIYSLEEIMKFFNQLCKQHFCRMGKKSVNPQKSYLNLQTIKMQVSVFILSHKTQKYFVSDSCFPCEILKSLCLECIAIINQ